MGRRVAVIGGGGREHALCEKLKRDKGVKDVFCSPGNAGTAYSEGITNIPYRKKDLDREIKKLGIDLVVIGPEVYLAEGLSDWLREKRIKVFGFGQQAARLESSKAFAKEFMDEYGVNTPTHMIFDDFEKASEYMKSIYSKRPDSEFFIKADELCGGKGSIYAQNEGELIEGLKTLMKDKKCGKGEKVVIEEKVEGEEATILTFTDGENFVLMPPIQDYKPLFDGNKGPNTGGMGSFAPLSIREDIKDAFFEDVLEPTKYGMVEKSIHDPGVLYFGLMIGERPYVLEYNVRFGDPETQAVLPLLESDLTPILEACVDGNLEDTDVKWSGKSAVCVILSTPGYPWDYKGEIYPIEGIEDAEKVPGVEIYHSGTSFKNNRFYTKGGRVLGITGIGNNIEEAREKAYNAIKKINFEGMYYRKDIGLNPKR